VRGNVPRAVSCASCTNDLVVDQVVEAPQGIETFIRREDAERFVARELGIVATHLLWASPSGKSGERASSITD